MKKKFCTTAALIGLSIISLPSMAGAALVNPSFETAGSDVFEAASWTRFGVVSREDWADGDGAYADIGIDSPADYGMVLQGWVNGGSGGFYQDIGVTVGTGYTFSANIHFEPGFNPSTFALALEWLDAGAAVISDTVQPITPITGSNPTSPAEWNVYSVTGTAPAGSVFVRTKLSFSGVFDIGGNQAGRVDNVDLVAVPEPSVAALLGLASLSVLLRRRL